LFAGLLTPACAEPDIMNEPSFWENMPAATQAREAWTHGAQLKQGNGQTLKYHLGVIYGFDTRQAPVDRETDVQAKLDAAYASRAEMRNVQSTGLFAFNDFDCAALAGNDRLQPDMNQCARLRFAFKFSGVRQGQAFSIIGVPVDNVCACLKALDRTAQGDNSRVFYGGIARNELNRLRREGKNDELLSFFEKNYKRRIFRIPEILWAAETYAGKGAGTEALGLLEVVTRHFAGDLNSEQYELCGELYYKLGMKEGAEAAYLKALELLND
jgi:tetratricopeptide (TPR) repeat protein